MKWLSVDEAAERVARWPRWKQEYRIMQLEGVPMNACIIDWRLYGRIVATTEHEQPVGHFFYYCPVCGEEWLRATSSRRKYWNALPALCRYCGGGFTHPQLNTLQKRFHRAIAMGIETYRNWSFLPEPWPKELLYIDVITMYPEDK